MPLYKIENNQIKTIERTSFAEQNLKERTHLQHMIKNQIDVISPNTLIVAEEFGDWEESRRRIDLLGIDKNANLIVIELKRTEDGGHMELQSIRYAAMISTLTFEKLVPIYQRYLEQNNIEGDATSKLLEFLDWTEQNDDDFAQEIKIILASADFSPELTTSVMWLNDFGIDIQCIRMHPYNDNGETYLDIQTVIPIPEAQDYQIKIREKKQKERQARSNSRDFTKFNVSVAGQTFETQSKRWMMYYIVSQLLKSGLSPKDILQAIPDRKFKVFDKELNADEVYELIMAEDKGGTVSRADRFFTKEGEFFHFGGKTYVLSNQWGKDTLDVIRQLQELFPKSADGVHQMGNWSPLR